MTLQGASPPSTGPFNAVQSRNSTAEAAVPGHPHARHRHRGNPSSVMYIAPHTGFSLRMPKDEVGAWTVQDEHGWDQPLEREVHGLRLWNSDKRTYDAIDPTCNGAPTSPEEADAWFVRLVKKLKASPFLGEDFVNQLVKCERYA
eukprot:TRINITY_DN16734_c0_g1_i3.p2 TRINITY_DN16734_c0_g1~~TRINITY_DN16734_c0_g1_i3.p2  ORF type:complete len:145 (-),score=30.54 TRINITY_DN16734_c0_g1_i3:1255-1689(-)